VPHLVDDCLSILQYVDDTIIFLDRDLERARNLKLLLCAFEQLSGLKINYHKSDFFVMVMSKRCRRSILIFLDAYVAHIHLNILGFLCIIRSLVTMFGK
jgi:hypothetical protein